MSQQLAALYPAHLQAVMAAAARALELGGFDHLLIPSGILTYRFLDDRPYPFAVNAQFKYWLPLTQHTDCWIHFTPGAKPVLVYYQPDDYWHIPPSPPSGFWVEHFDIRLISDPADAIKHLPTTGRLAIIGEANAALPGFVPNNPDVVINALHWARSAKTDYELANMRAASRRAAKAHRAAEQAFRNRGSELDIHRAYLAASGHNDFDLPYTNIVALNEHGATLHYQYQDARVPDAHHAFLIDAGAEINGYAADITRTYSFADTEFAELIAAVDQAQLALCDQVRTGASYPAIHLDTHRRIAQILADHDYVNMSVDAMLETRVTSTFFPHGVGHPLGLQVHDVAGFQETETGGFIARPDGHPYLRMTRTLGENFVVTIEPGLYFIDTLLKKLAATEHGKALNWDKIERMKKFGGVRIEDNVRATANGPENLTRDAFAEATA